MSEHDQRVQRRNDDSPAITALPVRICNIQGETGDWNLETHGFAVDSPESHLRDWRDDDELKEKYFPQVTELLKRKTGAKYVFQYEWHVRRRTLEEALKLDSTGAVDIDGPVRRVHIDEAPASALREYQYYVKPDEPGNEHLKGRPFGIYNTWKPLQTVRKDPLCLCDVRSIEDEDLEITGVFVLNVGEIQNISLKPPAPGRQHDFVYVREQRPDQALVFRIFDSRIDTAESKKRSHGVAHTSFVDPGTEKQAPRQSVEVRSFCIF